MTLELRKLLLGKLLHGEENFEKRINGGDRRKLRTISPMIKGSD
jgi:hypothetical protein